MKQIFIITGRTGAGKSTLCKKLEEYFHYPLLSFAGMGKQFAKEKGYNRIRECHLGMGIEEFKPKISEHILHIVKNQLTTSDVVLIDGLYIDEVVKTLKENYDCKLIYLKLDDSIRYERVSQRLSVTIEQAQEENKIKERLKDELGIEKLIATADYVIDGKLSIEEVFEATKRYIEK